LGHLPLHASVGFFVEINKLILKFIWDYKEPKQRAKE
jgi:hypothetical protein